MRKILYIALALIAISCERQLPIIVDGFERKLVVNAAVHSDMQLSMALSENVDLLHEPKYRSNIHDARLIVLENGIVIHDQIYLIDSGALGTTVQLQKGNEYELVLEAEDYPVVNAKDSMPLEEPDFRIVERQLVDDYDELTLELKDHDIKEYYLLELYYISFKESNGDTTWFKEPLNFNSSEKIFISNINTINANNHFALFDDKLIHGGTKTMKIKYVRADLFKYSDRTPYEVVAEMKGLSSVFFAYYLDLLENNHIYGGPLASTIQNSGNITGGLGIFGCYTRTEDRESL
ncbi:MAG: DUF4249 family protein [Bacteroidia bacterium]